MTRMLEVEEEIYTKERLKINVKSLNLIQVGTILEQISPDIARFLADADVDESGFYLAHYPYGSKIIENGKYYLALTDGGSIEFNDPNLPPKLSTALSFDSTTEEPLGVIVSKISELYLPIGSLSMSFTTLSPGAWLGITKAISQEVPNSTTHTIWNLNSGIRNIFTLVKISSKSKHIKLQKQFGITQDTPQSYADQWQVFRELSIKSQADWQSSILFFPRSFIKKVSNPQYVELAKQLLHIRRSSYNIWHNSSLIWDMAFSKIEQMRNLSHYSPYALATARQLFLIASNSSPAFRPATNDESAPVSLIKSIYNDLYGLTSFEHSDMIMEITNYNHTLPVYYSLNYPMLARYNPETFKGKSLITLLDNVERITRIYQETIPTINPQVTSLSTVALNTKFSFYHAENDQLQYKNILSIDQLLIADPRFATVSHQNSIKNSAFFKGCIKIEPRSL